MKATSRVTNAETAESRWGWLYRASGLAALIVGVLFLMGMIGLVITGLRPGATDGWLASFQDNWLIVLLKLNAGVDGVQFDHLHGLNLLDIAIMALVATTYLGLYAALRRTSRIWSLIAAAMPALGIVLLIATRIAGRSAVMGAGLVISCVMLRSNAFHKVIAWMGIVASALLLAGDVGTSANSHSTFVAMLMGIGCVLLMAWFFLIGQRLLQLGQGVSKEETK
jgi:hypothetical protein